MYDVGKMQEKFWAKYRENEGKIQAKCCQNVCKILAKYWQNVGQKLGKVGKIQGKCWGIVGKMSAKYWETISKLLSNCMMWGNCCQNIQDFHIPYLEKMFIEPLCFMYPKINLISINLNEAALSVQTFICAFNSFYLYYFLH